LGSQFRKDFGRDWQTPLFRTRDTVHGDDQSGQPKPTARLASPNLGLPFWPHRSHRLPSSGAAEIIPRLPACSGHTPERIRGDVICFT
jgi:hypothetical protein